MDNVSSHDESLQTYHPDIQILFLPPNTTSLLQPMDQSVISTFKAYYMRRVMANMLKAVNTECQNSTFHVKKFWKDFSILDSICLVDQCWNELASLTLNKCWSKILPDVVVQTLDEPSYEECV